jgi:hypothetical protein
MTTEKVTITIDTQEVAKLKEEAADLGMSLSAYVRYRLFGVKDVKIIPPWLKTHIYIKKDRPLSLAQTRWITSHASCKKIHFNGRCYFFLNDYLVFIRIKNEAVVKYVRSLDSNGDIRFQIWDFFVNSKKKEFTSGEIKELLKIDVIKKEPSGYSLPISGHYINLNGSLLISTRYDAFDDTPVLFEDLF